MVAVNSTTPPPHVFPQPQRTNTWDVATIIVVSVGGVAVCAIVVISAVIVLIRRKERAMGEFRRAVDNCPQMREEPELVADDDVLDLSFRPNNDRVLIISGLPELTVNAGIYVIEVPHERVVAEEQ